MTQVSRKGFRDKNGRKVVIIPPKEEYTGEAIFSDSDAIDTILSEGVHHISYKKDGKRHPTQHILVVTRDYGKTGPIAPTREIVYQLLIDDLGGMMKRYRKFTDTELSESDGDWTEWVSMIPTVDIDSTITEDGDNPVTGAAIYAALAGKMGTPIIMRLDGDGGDDYYLYGNGEDTNMTNINSVKNFIQATQQNAIVLCNVHVTHRAGAEGVPDDEYNIPGYAMWSLSGSTITVRLVVLGYVFECQVDGDLDVASSYSNKWAKTTFSL